MGWGHLEYEVLSTRSTITSPCPWCVLQVMKKSRGGKRGGDMSRKLIDPNDASVYVSSPRKVVVSWVV